MRHDERAAPMLRTLLLYILAFSILLAARSPAEVTCTADQNQPKERWPLDTSEEASGGPTEWMSKMRQHGIKVVVVEAAFIWNDGVESIFITDHRYYSSFSWGGSILLEPPTDSEALNKMLEDAARPIMSRQLQKLVPAKLVRSRRTRVRGTVLVALYNDPCHPVLARVGELSSSGIVQGAPSLSRSLRQSGDP